MANIIGEAGRAVFGDVGKDLADYLGRKFGVLPEARNEAEEVARRILELRQAGRSDEVTEKMMSAADDPYMNENTPLPMDRASREARADEMFPRKGYHGTKAKIYLSSKEACLLQTTQHWQALMQEECLTHKFIRFVLEANLVTQLSRATAQTGTS